MRFEATIKTNALPEPKMLMLKKIYVSGIQYLN